MASKKDMKPKNKVVRKPEASKPSSRRNLSAGSSSSKKQSLIQDITNRYRVTAREARDIVTAVSTTARAFTGAGDPDKGTDFGVGVFKKGRRVGTVSRGDTKSLAVKNLAKQVGEVYTAATKGKSGTESGKLTSLKEKTGRTRQVILDTPTKRKQGSKK
jgi:hypothetical protein